MFQHVRCFRSGDVWQPIDDMSQLALVDLGLTPAGDKA